MHNHLLLLFLPLISLCVSAAPTVHSGLMPFFHRTFRRELGYDELNRVEWSVRTTWMSALFSEATVLDALKAFFHKHDKTRDVDFYQVTAACDYLGKSSKQGRRSSEVKDSKHRSWNSIVGGWMLWPVALVYFYTAPRISDLHPSCCTYNTKGIAQLCHFTFPSKETERILKGLC